MSGTPATVTLTRSALVAAGTELAWLRRVLAEVEQAGGRSLPRGSQSAGRSAHRSEVAA